MAKRERQKRSSRQARQRERVERDLLENSASSEDTKAAKAPLMAAEPKKSKDTEPGFFSRVRTWFRSVRTEMGRVTWPSRQETKNYSVAVVITLIVFGIAIWAVDTGFVALLVAFTGLRG